MRIINSTPLATTVATILAVASLPATALAQSAAAGDSVPSRFHTGLGVDVMQPLGNFGSQVSSGVGLSGHGLIRLDRQGAMFLRFDASWLAYGRDTYRLPLEQAPVGITTPLDRETWNNVISLGVGPQYTATRGTVRPYVNATAGVAFFHTTSALTGREDLVSYRYETNVTHARFAWTGGAGVLVPLWKSKLTTGLLDVGAQYQTSGTGVRYLKKGGVRDLPDGAVQLDIQRGRADLIRWHAGVSMKMR